MSTPTTSRIKKVNVNSIVDWDKWIIHHSSEEALEQIDYSDISSNRSLIKRLIQYAAAAKEDAVNLQNINNQLEASLSSTKDKASYYLEESYKLQSTITDMKDELMDLKIKLERSVGVSTNAGRPAQPVQQPVDDLTQSQLSTSNNNPPPPTVGTIPQNGNPQLSSSVVSVTSATSSAILSSFNVKIDQKSLQNAVLKANCRSIPRAILSITTACGIAGMTDIPPLALIKLKNSVIAVENSGLEVMYDQLTMETKESLSTWNLFVNWAASALHQPAAAKDAVKSRLESFKMETNYSNYRLFMDLIREYTQIDGVWGCWKIFPNMKL